MTVSEYCSSFLSSIQVAQADLFGFTFGVLNMVLTLVLVGWLRRARNKALAGSAMAAQTLVLPIYLYIMYGVATADAFHGAVYLTCGFWEGSGASPVVCSILRGFAWGAHHFVLEGIAFFLLHQGAGTRVVSRSARLALLWGAVTTAIQSAAFIVSSNAAYLGLVLGYEAVLFAFYAVCWLAPARYLFRRPALASYAAYWCLVRALNAASYIMIDQSTEGGSCILAINTAVFFTLIQPLVVYRAFVNDSRYWQGIVPAAAVRSDIVQPLLGNQWGPASVAAMNDGLDDMHANRVRIINFGFLSLGAHQQVLGAGGTARVFRGAYRGESVAVKLMFCVELDADLIAAFCEEAKLLARLRHPNVVRLYGLCVVPPALCLVMELCEGGSLYSFLRARHSSLTWVQRLRLCAGCARALAFMHEQGLIHMDVKSLNFLVTSDMVAKIADLGTAREGPQRVDPAALTPNWTAPEVFEGEDYTDRSDAYALAMVLWEVLTARIPFDDPSARQVLRTCDHAVNVVERGMRPEIPAGTPPEFAELLKNGWAADPLQRMSTSDMASALDAMVEAAEAADAAAPERGGFELVSSADRR